MQEKIIETKVCKQCNSNFEITDRDMKFYEKVSPIFAGKKYNIPTPTLCPECRQQRRLTFRMERKLYKRKCDITGKNLISIYSPDKKDIVYDYDYWWSDKWEALDYGMEFDFSRNFFEQIKELFFKVPRPHIEISLSENSEYTNQAGYNKNCYLTFEAGYNEDCMYSKSIWNSTDTLDCSYVRNAHNCYECIDVENSYNLMFSQKSNNCRNSLYLFDCDNCENCIGCWNLNGKKYFVLNKEVKKDEFDEIFLKLKENRNYRKEFILEFNTKKAKTLIYKNIDNLLSQNAVGDGIIESKNCSGFSIKDSEDCYYCYDIYYSKDCMDYSYWGNNSSLILDSISVGNISSKVIFSYMCSENVDNLIYCMNCVNNSNNLFGCVGLNNKQYCIFNKQYTKQDYEIIVPKIIEHMKKTGEWGEFFPSNISPFGYNETVAMEYFPVSPPPNLPLAGEEQTQMFQFNSPPAREGLGEGKIFNRSDYETPFQKVEKIIPADKLPDSIKDIPDDILNWAIECEVTKKPFRIIKPELDFYRKHNLPIPTRHPDQRHLDRIALKNPRKLFDRKCDKCGIDMKTTYAPKEVLLGGSPEMGKIVYCEECYNREVY